MTPPSTQPDAADIAARNAGRNVKSAALVAVLLAAGLSVADAQPFVPPSEQPGRQRERFTPSPVDRFLQPQPTMPEPLIRRECVDRISPRSKQGPWRRWDC
jgi:hypothetical protein